MLSWYTAAAYGAVGGLVVEAVFMWRQLYAWQQARHSAVGRRKRPALVPRYLDPAPDLCVALSRAVLGAVAGLLLRGEVTGIYAALTVGASAPALLASLGRATTIGQAARAGGSLGPEPEPAMRQVPATRPKAVE